MLAAKKRCAYAGLTLSSVAKSKLKHAEDFVVAINSHQGASAHCNLIEGNTALHCGIHSGSTSFDARRNLGQRMELGEIVEQLNLVTGSPRLRWNDLEEGKPVHKDGSPSPYTVGT